MLSYLFLGPSVFTLFWNLSIYQLLLFSLILIFMIATENEAVGTADCVIFQRLLSLLCRAIIYHLPDASPTASIICSLTSGNSDSSYILLTCVSVSHGICKSREPPRTGFRAAFIYHCDMKNAIIYFAHNLFIPWCIINFNLEFLLNASLREVLRPLGPSVRRTWQKLSSRIFSM